MMASGEAALTQSCGRDSSAGVVFRQALVDRGKQRRRRERLAKAACGAELERHQQEVRCRRVETGEGLAGHRDQRNGRRVHMD
jgi:hypothetical protein